MNKLTSKSSSNNAVFISRFTRNPWLITQLLRLINMPIIRNLYHNIYYRKILREIRKTATRPKVLNIEGYNVCNLQCVMCPYQGMTRKKEQMQMDLFKKIVDDAVKIGIPEVNLHFYNEPFLDNLIFERIKYIKMKGLKTRLNTNGMLLNPEVIDFILESGLDIIVFSIDGSDKETYESIRVGARFETICANVSALLTKRRQLNSGKLAIMVHSTILSRSNLDSIKLLKQRFKGVDAFTVGLSDPRWSEDSSSVSDVNPFNSTSKLLYPCIAFWGSLTVMSNGKVPQCCMDYDGAYELGDLNGQTITEVWNSQKLQEARNLHFTGKGNEMSFCRHCDSLLKSVIQWWL